MKKNLIKTLCVVCLGLWSFSTTAQNKQTKTASFYDYNIECLEDKKDGSYIMMAWGAGSTKKEAIDQAQRNAISHIIFKGVNKSSCSIRPLITEVQAEEKYREYISNFFKEEYLNYISLERKSSKSKMKSRSQTTYGIKVKIDVEGIRKKLRTDNIIK